LGDHRSAERAGARRTEGTGEQAEATKLTNSLLTSIGNNGCQQQQRHASSRSAGGEETPHTAGASKYKHGTGAG
jgi:hypothetical protein